MNNLDNEDIFATKEERNSIIIMFPIIKIIYSFSLISVKISKFFSSMFKK